MGTDIHLTELQHDDGTWHLVGVFAMLANVRNGTGFAGVKTGEGFVPLSDPRGIPDDACKIVKEWAEQQAGHSASHVTLAELEAYDWTRVARERGLVSLPVLFEWQSNGAKGPPREWCGGVSGRRIVHLSQEMLAPLASQPKALIDLFAAIDIEPYVEIWWERTYAECAQGFLAVLPKLRELGPPERVRLVFFFDS